MSSKSTTTKLHSTPQKRPSQLNHLKQSNTSSQRPASPTLSRVNSFSSASSFKDQVRDAIKKIQSNASRKQTDLKNACSALLGT